MDCNDVRVATSSGELRDSGDTASTDGDPLLQKVGGAGAMGAYQ